MAYENLHILPLSLFILVPVTFLITYFLSLQLAHFAHPFPYISETGNSPPESCIFAQLLNISALLLGCVVYIRHLQVEQWHRERGGHSVNRLIILSTLWSGLLSCFGLDILANFQSKHIFDVHMVGAMTCFASGTLYFCFQSYLSKKMTTSLNGWTFVWIRSTLAILSVILTMMVIIPGLICKMLQKGKPYDKWQTEDVGWIWHQMSASAEWILAIVYCVFLLTFAPEFRRINLKGPEITLTYLQDKQQHDLDSSGTQDTTIETV